MAKRFLSVLLCVLMIASTVVFAAAAEAENQTVTVKNPFTAAAIELDTKYGYDGDDLGATYTPESTTFKVWAPTAQEIVLNLYATGSDNEEGAGDLGKYILEKEYKEEGNEDSFTGIWKKTIQGDLLNVYYTYTVTAENIVGSKVTTVETADVYSVAAGVNSKRSMVCDLDKTDPEGWENDKHVLLDKSTKSVVWEVHVKDFTYSLTSGVSDANRGKYLGFTETGTTLNGEGNISTCIDYLKELGVTTVQILPFYDYGSVDESGDDTQFNWGYDPVNYNVPEGSYSSNPYDGNVRIKECKQMIQALHNAGISVVMDVVYNHTYSYNSCFEAVVPNYYYRMEPAKVAQASSSATNETTETENSDATQETSPTETTTEAKPVEGVYTNGSGCGNETASERRMFRNYIIQSCKYWVEEYHIDGFRFDLMGLLDVKTMNLVREELDKIDPRITIWGEGWTGGGACYDVTNWAGETVKGALQGNAKLKLSSLEPIRDQVEVDADVAFFNDGIRDGVRGKALNATDSGWVQGGKAFRSEVRNGLNANTIGGKWAAQAPSQCVSYLSCHDNTTLWDKLCDSNGFSDSYDKRTFEVVRQNKLAAGLLAMSQGITFIHAGEEMGRTKLGDHNSYSSTAEVNMIDWSWLVTNADLVSYYKGLFDIRKNFDTLTDNTRESADKFVQLQKTSFTTISYVVPNDTEGQWKRLLFLSNNTKEEADYFLGDSTKEWVIIANNETAGLKNLGEVYDNRFVIPPRGIIIAVDKESYDALALEANTSSLVVEHIDSVTNKPFEKFTVTGEIGSKYQTMQTKSAGIEYKISEIEGNAVGTYTEEPQKVTYYYDYIVPDSVKVDQDGNGKLNINDATFLQKAAARMIELNSEQLSAADCNLDGQFNVSDITMLQKHLVGKSVSVGDVVVNYYNSATGEKIGKSLTHTALVGTKYTAEPIIALGYYLNTEKLPEKETVTVSYGEPTGINYYYHADPKIAENGVQLHIKHSGDLSWDPVLWLWGQKNGADSGSNYCKNKAWPGDVLTKADEDAWYTTSFAPVGGDTTYCVIISDGDSGRSPDCKGFTQAELWCVIDDENSKSSVSILFYDVNPDENPDAMPFARS